MMATVTVSPKFQVVIPQEVREAMGLKRGQKLTVYRKGEDIVLTPQITIAEARGMLAGLTNDFVRDKSDRES